MIACPEGVSGVWATAVVCSLTSLVVLVTSDSKLSSSCDSPSGKVVPPAELSSVVSTEDDGLVAAILAGPGIQFRSPNEKRKGSCEG